MRERIEDLGRLMVMISDLMEHPLFNEVEEISGRPKDFADNFAALSKDDQHEFISKLGYQLWGLKDHLAQCYEVATGQDCLNGGDEG